jgi:hypothetical protein
MFEVQYNEEMEAEIQLLEAKNRAVAAGHPDWENACTGCGCQLHATALLSCERCAPEHHSSQELR